MSREEMYQKKAVFVKQLEDFYINKVGNYEGIKRMDYVHENESEYVYVTFRADAQARFSVWGDNAQGILRGFVSFLGSDYSWLIDDKRIDFEEEK